MSNREKKKAFHSLNKAVKLVHIKRGICSHVRQRNKPGYPLSEELLL